jgi:hypothetical protein
MIAMNYSAACGGVIHWLLRGDEERPREQENLNEHVTQLGDSG